MDEFRSGQSVKITGKLKKVADFLASSDKETLKLLQSFFNGEDCDPIADAKRLRKDLKIIAIHSETIVVSLQRGEYVWEDQKEFFTAGPGDSPINTEAASPGNEVVQNKPEA